VEHYTRDVIYEAEDIVVIRSFADKEAERFFYRRGSKKLPGDIQQRAQRKLVMIDAAVQLEDLKVPPGNHLEPLRGDREGQYGIRINDQWRICFRWEEGSAYDVEITDYH